MKNPIAYIVELKKPHLRNVLYEGTNWKWFDDMVMKRVWIFPWRYGFSKGQTHTVMYLGPMALVWNEGIKKNESERKGR